MDANAILTTTLALMQGLGVVLLLFAVVLAASMPLGFFLTLLARCRILPVRWIVNAYIYVIRATPLMLQLFFIYFGLPYINKALTFSALTAALLGYSLNYAAYFAEIFRGGLLSVDKGQYEAAKVLGLNRVQAKILRWYFPLQSLKLSITQRRLSAVPEMFIHMQSLF